jgi:hypothetical protein
MESLKLCAYNQTVQRFLGLDIIAADFSDASLKDWMFTLTPRSGTCLWIVPFRGLPESAFRFLLDLVYLDENCRVIDVVESFPAFRVSASSPSAASVLLLPVHSISSSQTKPGHQLKFDIDEKMDRKLKRTSDSVGVAASKAQSDWLKGERERKEALAGLPSTKVSQSDEGHKSQSAIPLIVPQSDKNKMGRLKSWLNRRRCRDSRKAPRDPSPPLTAHFWTGASQEAHTVRDMSSSGLFVVTKERWHLGTTIRVMLTKTDKCDLSDERSICVNSRAVRWGNDGVGLHFVVKDSGKARRWETALEDGADRKDLDVFLKQLRNFGQPRLPIPELAARNRTKYQVTAPEKGADDHVIKHFSFQQLLTPVKDLLRRVSNWCPLLDHKKLRVSQHLEPVIKFTRVP